VYNAISTNQVDLATVIRSYWNTTLTIVVITLECVLIFTLSLLWLCNGLRHSFWPPFIAGLHSALSSILENTFFALFWTELYISEWFLLLFFAGITTFFMAYISLYWEDGKLYINVIIYTVTSVVVGSINGGIVNRDYFLLSEVEFIIYVFGSVLALGPVYLMYVDDDTPNIDNAFTIIKPNTSQQ
jgi:hypothetical protein